ncbi:hypothetical protein D3C73_706190 [compost metagenome]
MLERDPAIVTPLGRGLMLIDNSGPGVIDFDDLGQAGKKALNVVDNDPDVAHRVRYSPDQGRKGCEFTKGDPAVHQVQPARQHQNNVEGLSEGFEIRKVIKPHKCGFFIRCRVVDVLFHEFLDFVRFAGKSLDHPVAGNVLLCGCIELGQPLAEIHIHGADMLGKYVGHDKNKRGQGKHP